MPGSTHRLVFVGAATLDSIALVAAFPRGDERTIAQEIRLAGGGPAATAAVTAARLGHDVSYVGTVGTDTAGEQVLAGLVAEGVDVTAVQRDHNATTGTSVVLVHQATGARAITTQLAPPPSLAAGSEAAAIVADADWVHVDHLGWAPVHEALARTDVGDHPRLSVDAGNPIPGHSPAGTDLHVPTVEALEAVYGRADPDALLQYALDDGAHTVVATRGSAGCVAATRDGARAHVPGHVADVVSTLGAGDVFHGALVAAIARGYPLERQLRYANIAAALSCAQLDGRSAVPDHDTVRTVLETDPSRETV